MTQQTGLHEDRALVLAASNGEIEEVRELISAGHDINERWDDDGMTPLICAAERGYNGVAAFLIDCGADIHSRDNDGNTALDYVRFHRNRELAEMLIAKGARPRTGPSPVQKQLDDYYAAREYLNRQFLDDRMFVLEVAWVTRGSLLSLEREKGWSVITRRNVHGYPPTRTDDFASRDEAIAFVKRLAPTTPRVSLGGASPEPTPSWEEHQDWLVSIGVARLPYE